MSYIRKSVIFTILLISLRSPFLFSQPDYDIRDADKFANEEKWDDAAKVYSFLASENPFNGYYLSNYAYSLYKLKKYPEAIEIFKKAIDVGYIVSTDMYNIACCYSLMGKPKESIKWLNKSAENKFSNLELTVKDDRDFDPIRNTDLFRKEFMPSPNMFKNREEGWKTDLKFFKKRMEQTHFNLFAHITKDEWESSLTELNAKINDLDDAQIVTELLKICTKVGDGHTTVLPISSAAVKFDVLPLSFYMFEDGLYIISCSPDYKSLAGKKVLKIGNENASNILNRLKEVTPTDNEFGLKWLAMKLLSYPGLLYGLGISLKPDETEITTASTFGWEKTLVKAISISDNLLHSKIEIPGWAIARDTLNTPLYLKDLYNNYWYEYIPEQKMIYMQYNTVREKKDEPLQDFVNKLFDFINKNDIEYFVLDLRFNNGGDSFLNKILVHEIIKCDKINIRGKFFTIIGRNTFSAAMNLAGDLERETNVIFAGEPTGSKPNSVGETNIIVLPYSGLWVSCSSRYWQNFLSDDYRKWIAPQLGVKYFYEDYRNGTDPAMNEIIKLLINEINYWF